MAHENTVDEASHGSPVLVPSINIVAQERTFIASNARIECYGISQGHSTSASSTSATQRWSAVTVNIGRGTIFHPQASVAFYLPDTAMEHVNVNIDIGEFNIFEEHCRICLSLDTTDTSVTAAVSNDTNTNTSCIVWKAIGDYNTFGPKSGIIEGVAVSSIGNDNVLEAASQITSIISTSKPQNNNILSTKIGCGVVLTPGLVYCPMSQNHLKEEANDDDDKRRTNTILTNLVLFQMPRGTIHQRPHLPHGIDEGGALVENLRAQVRGLSTSLLASLPQHHKHKILKSN
jgi:hypothetical protein